MAQVQSLMKWGVLFNGDKLSLDHIVPLCHTSGKTLERRAFGPPSCGEMPLCH